MYMYLFFLFLNFDSENAQLRGNSITCSEPDGTFVDIKKISGGAITKPCVHCTCQAGSVNCSLDECLELQSCPLAEKSQKSCCPKCRSCTYLGIKRTNNEKWKSVQDPCYTLTCKAGIVTSSRVQCTNQCPDGIHIPGVCCKLCQKPTEIKNDVCLKCDLLKDTWYHCYRLACPVLDCPANFIRYTPKKCCPECIHPSPREYRTAPPENPRLQGYCTFQLRRFKLGETFHLDACTRCHCQPGGIKCRRFTCPFRQCHISAKLIFRKNVCCPFCEYSESKPSNLTYLFDEFRNNSIMIKPTKNDNEKITTCIYRFPNGTVLVRKHNSFWKASDCLNCQCRNGKTKCDRESCYPQEPFTCPKGSKKVKLMGKCCAFCEQYESTCTILGNSKHKTFDGVIYDFRGNKSYVLAQECGFEDDGDGNEQQPNFAIIAHYRENEKSQVQLDRISIISKILNNGTQSVLELANNKIFVENNLIVKIPKTTSVYSVTEISSDILQLSIPMLGIQILSNESFIELTLSSMHKGKVCGLCGNFNNNPSDDLWPKFADTLTDNIEQFAASWKWKTSRISHRCKTSLMTAQKVEELAQCRWLIDNKFFAFCRKQIHVHGFLRQCTRDVCECHEMHSNSTKPCFCNAIEAFATQCANRFIWGKWTQILQSFRQFPVHPQCEIIRKPVSINH